jgi:hypothetical protein
MNDIKILTDELVKFRDARNWQQFHNSKDLAVAISIEAVYSGLIDPSFRVIDPPAGGNNPEGRSLIVCNERLIC